MNFWKWHKKLRSETKELMSLEPAPNPVRITFPQNTKTEANASVLLFFAEKDRIRKKSGNAKHHFCRNKKF